jgi:hypothetical protein
MLDIYLFIAWMSTQNPLHSTVLSFFAGLKQAQNTLLDQQARIW